MPDSTPTPNNDNDDELKKIKQMVQAKYGEIAASEPAASSCCGTANAKRTDCETGVVKLMADEYSNVEGYNADADLGLGCGLPTQYACINLGDAVLDLGSGAGNDCFVARSVTGPTGKVVGVDFTPSMVERARKNAERRGLTTSTVEFVEGDIEQLPPSLEASTFDVVVSNCVLNLVPNKAAVFGQIWRVLKPGGHFSISDIVLEGNLPTNIQKAAEDYVGCVAGALPIEDYLTLIPAAHFVHTKVQKKKPIVVPDDVLLQHGVAQEELDAFHASGAGIYSITVNAEKPTTATD